MRKNLWQILALCLGISFLASVAFAKVWLLPDYQARQLYSHRVNSPDSSTSSKDPQGVNCHTYGLIPASEIGEGVSCSTQTKIMNVTCYGNCTCAPAYNKTESSCRLEGKIPGGSACMGEYYTECLCDTGLYPYTSSSCVHNLSGASCSDNNGKHYSKCVNPCEGLVDNTTDLGCESYYSQCPSMCEVGKLDPCEGLADNETELGCEKYYAECPSMCEVGKTCAPNDCTEYTLSSCPSGYACESCTPGCGNNTQKYKKTCAYANCSGYTLTSCPAGEECKSCTRGCGDNAVLYRTKGLAFQVDSPANGKISFSISGSDYQIDWGDGTIDTKKTHTYTTAGKYDVDIFGGVTSFSVSSGPTAKPIKLYSLNLPKAKRIYLRDACPTLTGTIPELPDSLTDGSYMFSGCSGLSGIIPALPDSLTNGSYMFSSCSGLTGQTPVKPSGLTSYTNILYGTKVINDGSWPEDAW